EDALRLAAIEAAPKLDALEEAEGDVLALACSDRVVASDVQALDAEAARLQEALAAVTARRAARLQRFDEETAQWTARRAAAGLPPPARAAAPRVDELSFWPYRREEFDFRERLAAQ